LTYEDSFVLMAQERVLDDENEEDSVASQMVRVHNLPQFIQEVSMQGLFGHSAKH